jgi:hypothetical protein
MKRLSENAHLPFDKPFDKLTVLSRVEGLMALSKVDPSTSLRVDAEQRRSIEGLRYPYPSSLRRTTMYASFLGISEAPVPRAGSTTERDFARLNLHMDIFQQPLISRFFDSLNGIFPPAPEHLRNCRCSSGRFSRLLECWSPALLECCS